MIQSMTGYANAIIETPIKNHEKLSLSIHIKSLNSKYFEATCKIPHLLAPLEVGINKLLKNKLHRGHVYITIKIQHDSLKSAVIPSMKTVHGYLNAITQIQKECNINEPVSLQTLLGLPHILQIEDEDLSKETQQHILDNIDTIIDQLVLSRETEGITLIQDILEQTATIAQKIAEIKTASNIIGLEKKEKLNAFIAELQSYDQDELSANKCLLETQKNVILSELEKIDINEEIVRINAHIQNLHQWLEMDQVTKGKKLDFILQELNREINTIASKCSNFVISSLAIDIKTALEKCREQAQNIV